MIAPTLQDDALLADIAEFDAENAFAVWWLGQSGFLIKWRGRHLLLDPYLSDSLTRKYAGTGREHIRITGLCADPGQLDMIDVVTASHIHTDHLDVETLRPIAHAVHSRRGELLPLVLPEAIQDAARDRLGAETPVRPVPGEAGRTVTVAGFEFTGIPAAHNELERDAQGRHLYLGWIIRFGPWCIYHSGDTLMHPGLIPAIQPWKPDLVFVPVNGNKAWRGVAGNMNGTTAAALALACGARVAIPHHYAMFTFNTESINEFRNTCLRLGQPYAILRCGERHIPFPDP